MRVLLFILALWPALASAQALCPSPGQQRPVFPQTGGNVFGLLSSQWQQLFGAKADANNGTLCNATFTGSTIIPKNTVVQALGFTPMNGANNLSEIVSQHASRTNLGFGTGGAQIDLEPMQVITGTGAQTCGGLVSVWKPTTPAATTCTLDASPAQGQRHTYENRSSSSAFALTVARSGSQTIVSGNGAGTSYVLTNPGSSVTFRFDGVQWGVE